MVSAAYLVGSVDFAVVIARARGVDIYQVGSGNPGAANVARALGKGWAALVMAGDLAKGVIGSALGGLLVGSQAATLAGGLVAVVGHCFPIWHRFRGGKGVSTALGALLWSAPPLGAGLAVLWVIVVLSLGISSVASLLAVILSFPGLVILGHRGWSLLWSGAMVALVVFRHHDNIRRLLAGRERKVHSLEG